ncbi:MAG: hypothetical protein IPM02_22315 [Betaproteobacteria bacterium]|nr:hypothetical protein [Betaproteobacteria bacterium]
MALARNPADYGALLNLALQLERDGSKQAAIDAAAEALRLAPTDQAALAQATNLFLRLGEEAPALAILRRFVELYPGEGGKAWPVFAAALDTGRHGEFFAQAARDNPSWWTGFFGFACGKAALGGVQSVFALRISAGTTTPDERRCIVARLQREGKWTAAYQTWLNSLPADQRQRVGFVFNGGFESPLSFLGFDWLSANQDAVTISTEPTEGATGKRALHMTFVNKRYSGHADLPVSAALSGTVPIRRTRPGRRSQYLAGRAVGTLLPQRRQRRSPATCPQRRAAGLVGLD